MPCGLVYPVCSHPNTHTVHAHRIRKILLPVKSGQDTVFPFSARQHWGIYCVYYIKAYRYTQWDGGSLKTRVVVTNTLLLHTKQKNKKSKCQNWKELLFACSTSKFGIDEVNWGLLIIARKAQWVKVQTVWNPRFMSRHFSWAVSWAAAEWGVIAPTITNKWNCAVFEHFVFLSFTWRAWNPYSPIHIHV